MPRIRTRRHPRVVRRVREAPHRRGREGGALLGRQGHAGEVPVRLERAGESHPEDRGAFGEESAEGEGRDAGGTVEAVRPVPRREVGVGHAPDLRAGTRRGASGAGSRRLDRHRATEAREDRLGGVGGCVQQLLPPDRGGERVGEAGGGARDGPRDERRHFQSGDARRHPRRSDVRRRSRDGCPGSHERSGGIAGSGPRPSGLRAGAGPLCAPAGASACVRGCRCKHHEQLRRGGARLTGIAVQHVRRAGTCTTPGPGPHIL
mmetsp:Transcript_4503/g.9510  ORF Transcript_4503/g.9510 Transcript_4503/m.9510 type:complete len:262 (+) Transcript_4503:718-1503(+)